MARKEFKSQISLNIPGIVPSVNVAGSTAAAGLQLSEISASLFAEHERDIKENEPKIKRMGAQAGADAGVKPGFKLRDIESTQVFDIAYNKAGRVAYIAQMRLDSIGFMGDLETENQNDPKKYQAASDAYIEETLRTIDPRLKTDAEFVLRQMQANSGIRVADARSAIIRQQQRVAITDILEIDQNAYFDMVRETGLTDVFDAGIITQQVEEAVDSGIYNAADQEAFDTEFKFRESLSLGYFQMKQITDNDIDGTGADSHKFLEEIANGNTELTDGMSTKELANFTGAMKSIRDQLNYAVDIAASEFATQAKQAKIDLRAQYSFNLEQNKPYLSRLFADGKAAEALKWQTAQQDAIDRDIANGLLDGNQGTAEKESIQKFMNSQLVLREELTLARGRIDAAVSLDRPVPFTRQAIADANLIASDNVARGEWEFYKRNEDGGWDNDAMLNMQQFLLTTGHLPNEFTGRITTGQLTGEELSYWAQFYGPLLDPANELTGETLLNQIPAETEGLMLTITQMYRDGRGGAKQLELLLKDKMGRSLQEHQSEVLQRAGIEIIEGESVNDAWRTYAAKFDLVSDFINDGKLTWFENVTSKNLRYQEGSWGKIGSFFQGIGNLVDAEDEMFWFDPVLPPEFQETVLNYFTQSSMMYDTDEASQKNAMDHAMSAVMQNSNWGVSTFGGKMTFVKAPVEKWDHPDFDSLPQGWDHARSMLVEYALYDQLIAEGFIDSAMIKEHGGNPASNVVNMWDGEALNYQEMLEEGRISLIVIGSPKVGVIPRYNVVIKNKEGRVKLLEVRRPEADGTIGPNSRLMDLVFQYPQAGPGMTEIGTEYGDMAKSAAVEAKALVKKLTGGSNSFITEMVFNEIYYEKFRQHREGMSAKRKYNGISGILKRDADMMLMEATHKAGSSLDPNDAVNRGDANISLVIQDNGSSKPLSGEDFEAMELGAQEVVLKPAPEVVLSIPPREEVPATVVPAMEESKTTEQAVQAVDEAGPLPSVSFDPGTSNVSKTSVTFIKSIADQLKDDPKKEITIYSYSDEKGNAEARRKSLSRALIIRTLLKKLGIKSTRITVRSMGNKLRGGKPSTGADLVIDDD